MEISQENDAMKDLIAQRQMKINDFL